MTLSKTVTSKESGTSIEEIAEDLFRISTPVDPEVMPGGFTFNQFLIVDDEPLLFHTGPRGSFPPSLGTPSSTFSRSSASVSSLFLTWKPTSAVL